MKREILFRGKKMDNGKWEYGFLSWNDSPRKRSYHINNDVVYSETVGQFTGLTDKNGTKIFEGDIIEVVSLDVFSFGEIKTSYVKYENGSFRLSNNSAIFNNLLNCESTIIGNVHDNKELIK